MQGVTILNRTTEHNTQTDEKGKFTITAEEGQVLAISYVGYEAVNITVGKSTTLSIRLAQANTTLEDVVVVGYGTQRRANLTGAVSTINVDKTLGSRSISDVGRGLQGTVPGLTITTPSGDLGTNPTITLRGLTGSVNTSASPLILVDNVEFPLIMVNPDDIESISVLKDAASTSIYGTRGAWGVVLITTKSGKKGGDKASISYRNNFSWAQPTTMPEVAPAVEGAEMTFKALQRTSPGLSTFGIIGFNIDQIALQKMKEWQKNFGGLDLDNEMVNGRDFEIRDNKLYFYRPWDPGDMYMRDWTPQQNHNLTLSGSSNKIGYTLGLGFMDQKGVLKVNPDKFQRYNLNLGVTAAATPWLDARAKVMLSRSDATRPFYFASDTYDPWYYLYRWPAVYPYGTYQGKPFRSALTEVQQAKMNESNNTRARLNIGGTFKLAKGLTLDADYTYDNGNSHQNQTGGYVSAIDFWNYPTTLAYLPYTAAQWDRAVYNSYWDERNTVKAYATYNKKLGDHDLKAMAGTDIELNENWFQNSERRGLLNTEMGEPNLAVGDQLVNSSHSSFATNGYFGRINYTYKNKILLELNGRYDGSSQFPLNDQWAFFPSVSAGYKISDEAFMDFAKPVLSSLKFRGSWGSVGNHSVGAYRFLKTMTTSLSNWLLTNTNLTTVSTPGLVSPTLTWETVNTLDFGADARFFKNKMGVTFDWYQRTTSDMVTGGLTVPSTLGTSAPARNFGELTTTGWELTVDWNHQFGNGLNFNVTGVLSDFKEELTKFANTTKLLSGNYEGRVLGEIWGYETDRFFTKDDFEKDANGNLITQNGKYVLAKGVPTQALWEASWFFYGPGDIKYKDLNNDGKIDYGKNSLDDHGDLKVIGNTTPRYQYGIRMGADWKGVDISLFIQGVGKREQWPSGPIFIPGFRASEAWYAHQLDYWTEENPNAFYPRPTNNDQSNNTRNFLIQSKYLLNMAYTRLKNVNIGYTLPAALSNKVKLKTTRVYFSGENLLTIDHLDIPIDPEVNYTPAGLNDGASFGRVYPYRKSFSFGVQVTL